MVPMHPHRPVALRDESSAPHQGLHSVLVLNGTVYEVRTFANKPRAAPYALILSSSFSTLPWKMRRWRLTGVSVTAAISAFRLATTICGQDNGLLGLAARVMDGNGR